MTANVLLALYGILSILNLCLMLGLHVLHDRKGYYLTAAGVWVGLFLSMAGDGYVAEKFGNVMHIFGFPLIAITTYSFAKLASVVYKFDLPFRKLALLTLAAWLCGAASHYFLSASFAVSSLIVCIGVVAPSLAAVHKLFGLRSKRKLTVLDRLFGFAILAESLHILDYPFLRLMENSVVVGFSFAVFLLYLVSILVPVVINVRIGADLSETLERKVEERTQQLLEAREQLVNTAKLSALGEMAGGVAHEINTPLAVIGMLTEQGREILADEAPDRAELMRMNRSITDTVKKISFIVQGLRNFARDGGQDPFAPAPVGRIVDGTLALCHERMKDRGIRVVVGEIPADCVIRCREAQISQVLLNLIANACDAVASLQEKWIRIDVERLRDDIRILVTDSGSGLSESVKAKVFQPFFSTKEIGKGKGLSLSVSKGIMEMHRGTLSVDASCPNTRFVVECPAAAASAESA